MQRMCMVMYAVDQVPYEAARGMFAEAINLVVQVGWRQGKRQGLGIWEVARLSGDHVAFRPLWQPAETAMLAPGKVRL